MTSFFRRDPSFGWDPWIGPETPPIDRPELFLPESQTQYAGADTIRSDIGLLPSGLSMYGSYVDNYCGYDELVARFGNTGAFLLSITIFGNRARCGDVEPGAMRAADLPHWLDNVAIHDGGLDPWVYTSASSMASVNHYVGSRRVVRWSAHYGFGPHVCGPGTCGWPQADWTQWTNAGPLGQNYDRSLGLFVPQHVDPPLPPLPPGVDPMSVAITTKPDGNLVALAQAEAKPGEVGEVFALWTTAPGGDPDSGPVWHGVPGQTHHKWVSLGVPGT